MEFKLEFTSKAIRSIRKYIKSESKLEQKFINTFEQLATDPFAHNLSTHKISSKKYGTAYSSRISGDLRVLWQIKQTRILLIVTVGSHSGKRGVY